MNKDVQPKADHAVAPAKPLALSAHNATRSRHWRFWLGLFHVLTGFMTGFLAVSNTVMVSDQLQEWQVAGQRPPGGALAIMIALIICFSVVSIAGVVIGFWNLRTMRGTAPRPMKAAIVVSVVSIVLLTTFIDGPLNDPGKIGLPVLHAFVAAWTVGILRLKKVPTQPDAIG